MAIDDRLLELAKERAHERRVTLGQLVELALQKFLMEDLTTVERHELPVFSGGGGFLPGIDPRSNRSLYEAMDDEYIASGRIPPA